MLHAWGPKDGKKPPKTNFTIQEIEDIISAIEWSNPAPPNKNRIDHRMYILESLGDKIYVRNLRDFRDMVENAIDELQRKQQTETKKKDGGVQKEDKPTGEALALAMLVEHPDWPDTKIAKAVGVNRTTLYDWPNFKKAKEALKQGKKEFPKGSKNGETGNVEAWEADT